MKALHFVSPKGTMPTELLNAVREIPGLELETDDAWEGMTPEALAERIRSCDILLASRAPRVPDALAANPGKLKYICYLHGTMRKVIGLPIIQSPIKVTNWGDSSGPGLAANSFTLLLAMLQDLPKRILAVRRGEGRGINSIGGRIFGLHIGVYGFGFAGRQFVRLLAPFNMTVRVYDPYADAVPEPCIRVDSLEALFAPSQAIVIHAGLTDETRSSVTRELLAMLPDQGVVINTARGAIIDQDALFAELKTGRLRAGLDVLWPDDLSPDHEARQWENLIWTCHECGSSPWPSTTGEDANRRNRLFLDNIRAFVEGRPLAFEIDETRYARMT